MFNIYYLAAYGQAHGWISMRWLDLPIPYGQTHAIYDQTHAAYDRAHLAMASGFDFKRFSFNHLGFDRPVQPALDMDWFMVWINLNQKSASRPEMTDRDGWLVCVCQ